MPSESEGKRRVRELFDGLDLNNEQVDMVRDMLGSEAGADISEYVGRYEIGGYGHDFLPDAETDMGDVPSVNRWIEDALDVHKASTIRVRITVERLDA